MHLTALDKTVDSSLQEHLGRHADTSCGREHHKLLLCLMHVNWDQGLGNTNTDDRFPNGSTILTEEDLMLGRTMAPIRTALA